MILDEGFIMRLRRLTIFFILLLLVISFYQSNTQIKSHLISPRLVVVIVVDQMRADHLTRFAGVYQYGLARLYHDGAVFNNAHHDHAFTQTGPGHATLSTGCFPSHHGIVLNSWFDRSINHQMYCAGDTNALLLGYPSARPKDGRSPKNLLRNTLADWMKTRYPHCKVFGVARKDRAAILSTGHKADGAFWYNDDDGHLVTSTYYYKKYPEWAKEFNGSAYVNRYADSVWSRLLPEETYFLAREDSFPSEADGEHTQMPYQYDGNKEKLDNDYYEYLENTPFVEDLHFHFAELIVEKENLGQDEIPDFLFLGCSAADAVGHRYGPLSQEDMDYYMRLDRYLGKFFDFLDQQVGKNNYVVALSSDHGVLPIPEELARRGFPSKRYSPKELRERMGQAFASISRECGITESLFKKETSDGILLNYEVAQKYGISPEKLDSIIVKNLRNVDPVAEVYTARELKNADTDEQPYVNRYRHSYHEGRSADIFFRFKPYYLFSSGYGTSHGSSYDYDTHVPLVLMGPGIRPGQYDQNVRTIDLAPTLAEILGIEPENEIDGQSLASMIRK